MSNGEEFGGPRMSDQKKYTSMRVHERSARILRSVCAAKGLRIAEAFDEAINMYAENNLPADMIAQLNRSETPQETKQ